MTVSLHGINCPSNFSDPILYSDDEIFIFVAINKENNGRK